MEHENMEIFMSESKKFLINSFNESIFDPMVIDKLENTDQEPPEDVQRTSSIEEANVPDASVQQDLYCGVNDFQNGQEIFDWPVADIQYEQLIFNSTVDNSQVTRQDLCWGVNDSQNGQEIFDWPVAGIQYEQVTRQDLCWGVNDSQNRQDGPATVFQYIQPECNSQFAYSCNVSDIAIPVEWEIESQQPPVMPISPIDNFEIKPVTAPGRYRSKLSSAPFSTISRHTPSRKCKEVSTISVKDREVYNQDERLVAKKSKGKSPSPVSPVQKHRQTVKQFLDTAPENIRNMDSWNSTVRSYIERINHLIETLSTMQHSHLTY